MRSVRPSKPGTDRQRAGSNVSETRAGSGVVVGAGRPGARSSGVEVDGDEDADEGEEEGGGTGVLTAASLGWRP
ncbi:hypothetical protein Cma02nite_26870 [Cellulomonas marina]|nr:hypothetical protein Cma02nite_26870 [Cellulomonas marina]